MSLPTGKRPGGRRAKREPKPGQRAVLSVRIQPELKQQIDEAAAARGWSQGHEVEYRLTRSADREGLLFEALSLRHGPMVANVIMALSDALRHLGQVGSTIARRERHVWDIDNWLDDSRAFETVLATINATLDGLHPLRRGVPNSPAGTNPAANWDVAAQHCAHLALLAAIKRAYAVNYAALIPGKQRREDEMVYRDGFEHLEQEKKR